MENKLIDLKAGKDVIVRCLLKGTSVAHIAAVGFANSPEEERNSRRELLEFIRDWGVLASDEPLVKDVDRMFAEKDGVISRKIGLSESK